MTLTPAHSTPAQGRPAGPSVTDCAAWLAAEQAASSRERSAVRAREWVWSWMRLAAFALIIVVFIQFAGHGPWRVIATLAAIALFGWFVRLHNRIRGERERLDRLLLVQQESQQRCGGSVVRIRSGGRPDAGTGDDPPASAWRLTDQELDDLDLYAAPVGIFGLLNRCSTIYGERRLSGMLEHPLMDVERITARQQAVMWLEQHPRERFSIMAAAAVLRDQDKWLQQLQSAVDRARSLDRPATRAFLRFWSFASVIILLYALLRAFEGSTGWALNAIAILAWNSLLFQLIRRDLARWLEPWREVSRPAGGMLLLAREAAATLPENGRLGEFRQQFHQAVSGGTLPRLCRWLPYAETGGLMQAFFNHAAFYDLHVAERIAAQAIPGRAALLSLFDALGSLEASCSLACLAWEQPLHCYATFTHQPEVEILGGCHPLIEPGRAVPNNLQLSMDLRTWIITGSNMAGKSTFLRMVGINVLLAQMGGPCLARAVRLRPVRLISDLRARDNLAREESYFLAEVRQLRRMVLGEASGENASAAPIIGLIDEPFRGTNSQERLAASLAVVEHLIDSGGFFLIATHETGLTDLADRRRAANYHFQEKLEQNATVFDYALRSGPATTRNALRVLEREGYPSGLMKRARHWMAEDGKANE